MSKHRVYNESLLWSRIPSIFNMRQLIVPHRLLWIEWFFWANYVFLGKFIRYLFYLRFWVKHFFSQIELFICHNLKIWILFIFIIVWEFRAWVLYITYTSLIPLQLIICLPPFPSRFFDVFDYYCYLGQTREHCAHC